MARTGFSAWWWRATGAALAAGVLMILAAQNPPPAPDGGTFLSPPQALAAAQSGERLLIDIRAPDEWRKTGVAQGARLADYNGLGRGGGFIARIGQLTGGDKSAPIALICATGGRSSRAARLLEAAGYKNVRDVHEGMMGNADGPGWLARGLPVARQPAGP